MGDQLQNVRPIGRQLKILFCFFTYAKLAAVILNVIPSNNFAMKDL